VAAAACPAAAQIRPDEVLVVYDSRSPDSLAVAEYYAGSKRVPGGAGGLPGARPGVRVLNLASTGAAATSPGDISYADFVSRLRTPIRAHLTAMQLERRVRVLVTTKGLPHRIQDTDFPTAGDNPTNLVNEYTASDATCASVDTELTLLWQDLNAGEAGGPADSKADGAILNPFWRSALPIGSYPTANNQAAKLYSNGGTGPMWVPFGSATSPSRLTPGDLYLVCRLDGYSVADVRGAIDRAGAILYDANAHRALLDESGSNGVADVLANTEFDNSNTAFSQMRDADDYETTRDAWAADTRFASGFVRYNALAGGNQFFIGPRLAWFPGDGIMVTEPIVLVGTYGANHSGLPRDPAGNTRRVDYAGGYNYPAGAIINSIESYNCRDFGGVGQLEFAMQQQVAGFIAVGGTFGVGNCWEPLADAVPDNRYLAQNFVRGNMSWAEAAWTSIPALSWQEMVVGDPLGRPFRTSEDITGDGRVNIDDLYAWEASPADVNRNGTTDAADRAFVVAAVRSWERSDLQTPRE
jgi:hypothetical protein